MKNNKKCTIVKILTPDSKTQPYQTNLRYLNSELILKYKQFRINEKQLKNK